MPIPIIDIFAGPGGLGEGFSNLFDSNNNRYFKISLSIEKERFAHQTLTLRSFFRQFVPTKVPKDYYDFVKGDITLEELYQKWPAQSSAAKHEAWNATLGEPDKADNNAVSDTEVDTRIREALHGESNWLLIGGPPCQAYSVVGRSRRKQKILSELTDKRVGLYKQYLRILAIHNPAVFVMENVKGLLSAETEESLIFSKILSDLSDPKAAYLSEIKNIEANLICPGYKIYALTKAPKEIDLFGTPLYSHKDFIIRSEKYGIPQSRHRVILLGVRNDIFLIPNILDSFPEIPISKVLSGLPRLRSTISKSKDGSEEWIDALNNIFDANKLVGTKKELREKISSVLTNITVPHNKQGRRYIASKKINIDYKKDWFLDSRSDGVTNHVSRGHMTSDLHRYLFASCFAKLNNRSPKLEDFPIDLLPNHENVQEGIDDRKFADRFRVQLWNKPAKTITSHISKDGHYYIHPDPSQCRSFTVREAARIQTFPDNYFFCGPRTAQFTQVGNAVPPLLANQIALIVYNVFSFYQ